MMKLMLVVCAVMLTVPAFASSPGGSDACGLGWEVTKSKTMIATTTRATTNYFIPYTFGMTTGTMGCDQHPLVQKEMDAAKYAVNNYDTLSIEMAQGQGEFLSAFAQTMGCSDAVAVGQLTQANYSQVTNAKNGLEMYDNVRHLIRSDVVLGNTCVNII